jgi:hypothetical protein
MLLAPQTSRMRFFALCRNDRIQPNRRSIMDPMDAQIFRSTLAPGATAYGPNLGDPRFPSDAQLQSDQMFAAAPSPDIREMRNRCAEAGNLQCAMNMDAGRRSTANGVQRRSSQARLQCCRRNPPTFPSCVPPAGPGTLL